MNEAQFISKGSLSFGGSWDGAALAELSGLNVPDNILGRRRSLLRADINEQWAMWFVESLLDPRQYTDRVVSYGQIFSKVFKIVEDKFHSFTKSEITQIASAVARPLFKRIEVYRPTRQRIPLSRSEKNLLIDISGKSPRCWICGGEFTEIAIDNFLQQERHQHPLPDFVDIFFPKGLKQRDFAIEIDHVIPHAHGGNNYDNLRLACGWCNRHKSDLLSVYDVEGRPRFVKPNALQISSLPQHFWTIRLLAIEKRCEHREGCDCTTDNCELTIAPICVGGAMNPTNLKVTCYDHDPLISIRHQPIKIVKQLWDIQ